MSFLNYVYLYVCTIPIFFLIDMIWLGVIAKNFYHVKLAHLLGPVNWTAAIIFYLLFIAGIMIFAVVPALESGTVQRATLYGALFGFFTYATYDLTNLATLKDWPLSVTLVDMVWGAFLSSTVAASSYAIGRALFY